MAETTKDKLLTTMEAELKGFEAKVGESTIGNVIDIDV